MVGNAEDAFDAWFYPMVQHEHVELIGHGESRVVYLVNGVVYKVGRPSANRYEHELLTAWRAAGAQWAPATSLWEDRDPFGEAYTVIAMDYLPDDGSDPDEATLAEIRRCAPQTCRENLHTHAGQLYLIDGVDIEVFPA